MKPMLCHTAPGRPPVVPTGDQWIVEPKHDGIRLMVERRDGTMFVYGGRNHANHTGRYTVVEQHLIWLPGTILDGELVKLANAPGGHLYIVFDVLVVASIDVRHEPWTVRRALLEKLSEQFVGPVLLNKYAPASQGQYEEWVEQGHEGAVAKRIDSRYQSGRRSWDWQKCKPEYTAEATIVSFEMGRGKSNGHVVSSMNVQMAESGAMTSVGVSGDVAKQALADPQSLIGRLVEIKHYGIFADTGIPRHPGFVRLRPDLEAQR
jgi:bifunctional non-homologous end joining protein LigD